MIRNFLLTLVILLGASFGCMAANRYLYVILEPFEFDTTTESQPNNPNRRLPGLYYWEKTENGEIRCDVNGPILQYEIRDNNGGCLCSAETEEEFIKYLSCLRGTYTVRLITEDIIYIGQITIS